ncbi:plastid terminal oxidase-like protein [Fragilariopsis cylindrus CCMP1102]|uniref:Plastid terminal oxidase-like protein n=1 Tax=Fragilariopsis cylindrus CCMP1102 TaxID=635003 RepID=A0A1E7EKZ8_9STRA|nr:plastid terminal oxidase-like protein [Fragilariopsis cylindrus CCMP1102]|eukprot:OEU06599.1 plastid terminal oxidase-like protein [Fragilariopsis cylindrus CCMP1102]
MMNIIVTALSLISAVHGWTINNNPTAVLLSLPSSSRYCSRINNAVDVLVRQQQQRQSPQQRQASRLCVVLSASSTASSTDTSPTSITTDVDCDQQQDYDECIIDEDMLLSDCAELESFISSATSTASASTAAIPDTDHNSIMVEDTIYEQLHDDKGKSLLSTIIIPKNTADEDKDESSTTTTTTTIDSTATSTGRSRPAAPAPAAPYYEFNKIIVNTMYTIISFLYPTITTSSTETTATTDTDDDYSTISLSPKQKQQIQEIQQQQQIQKKFQTNYEHFYILEIIARVPYFAYLSCMHLQETFGSRYGNTDTTTDNNSKNMNYDNTADQVRIEKMRLFYAQADNELHHLLIIEDLLGLSSGKKSLSNNNNEDKKKKDHRTIIAHSLATIYYWYTVFVYLTHGKVVSDVPDIAYKYYDTDNQYLLNLLYSSSSSSKSSIQPNNDIRDNKQHKPLSNLYDVFMNIRNDEKEHYNTLCKLQQEPQQQEQHQ